MDQEVEEPAFRPLVVFNRIGGQFTHSGNRSAAQNHYETEEPALRRAKKRNYRPMYLNGYRRRKKRDG